MNKLKYANYYIGYQEVPNEVPLCFNISDCPYKCKGCHSKYLWDYVGTYLSDDIDSVIKKYSGMITCVCFMGGDQNIKELCELLEMVKKKYELKTCVYSGCDNVEKFNSLLSDLDFLKIGRYIEQYGGLDNILTNQKFYIIDHSNSNILVDYTTIFLKNNFNTKNYERNYI